MWNRTAAKADQLVAQGAKLADSVGDGVAASPLVIVCVADYDAVHELLDPLGEVLNGRVLVNLTSGTSAQARETAEWAARRASTYLDGAIMAIPAVKVLTDQAIADGHGGNGYAAMIEQFRKPSGVASGPRA